MCADWSTSSWWLQRPWCQLCTISNHRADLTAIIVKHCLYYEMHCTYIALYSLVRTRLKRGLQTVHGPIIGFNVVGGLVFPVSWGPLHKPYICTNVRVSGPMYYLENFNEWIYHIGILVQSLFVPIVCWINLLNFKFKFIKFTLKNANVSSKGFRGIHLGTISQEMLMNLS